MVNLDESVRKWIDEYIEYVDYCAGICFYINP